MQQNPNPQAEDAARIHTKSRRTRPFTIEARTLKMATKEWNDWYIYGKYRTADERNQALETLSRKSDLRIAGGACVRWIEYRPGPTEE